MPSLPGFGLTNFRCFDEAGFLIERVTKVTIFIGKNNSGKSAVLRALDVVAKGKSPENAREVIKPQIDPHCGTQKPLVASMMLPLLRLLPGTSKDSAFYGAIRQHVPDPLRVSWSLDWAGHAEAQDLHRVPEVILNQILNGLLGGYHPQDEKPLPVADCLRRLGPLLRQIAHNELDQALRGAVTVPISRQIRGVTGDAPAGQFDGNAIIPDLREMQHPPSGQDEKQQMFKKIERLVGDMLGDPRLTLEIPSKDEVLVRTSGVRRPLDNFGTGVHHIVLLSAALAMHSNRVIIIEEPETHLHPDLQRKFLRFIAEQTDNTYLLTTHSNVFLDAGPNISIYHLLHDGKAARVEPVDASQAVRAVLTDMGYKASDLLQANGIVWVEGPSDRIYLNKWLSLVAPDLKEGVHYAVAFYGGKVLAHFSGEDDPVDDLVRVLRINRNALLMIDRDGDDETAKLNASKERIIGELGEGSYWVTQGREVENYLSASLVERWLKSRCPGVGGLAFGANDRIGEIVAAATRPHRATPINYDVSKPAYAREICAVMTNDDLTILDLRERLEQVVSHIRRWNQTGGA